MNGHHNAKAASGMGGDMHGTDNEADCGEHQGWPQDRRILPRPVKAAPWHGWLLGCALALACASGGRSQTIEFPVIGLPEIRTNLLWNASKSQGITNYIACISNQFGLFIAAVGNTNVWRGIMTSRAPTYVSVAAQAAGTTSTSAQTNFFVQSQLLYSVIAQTGTLSGFSDWKPMGSITGAPGMLFRLRTQVTVTN